MSLRGILSCRIGYPPPPLVGQGTEIPDDHAVHSRSVRCRFFYWNFSEYGGRA